MSLYNVIDTYSQYVIFWSKVKALPLTQQVDLWAEQYMSAYPELLHRQIQQYADEGVNWRDVAGEMVFPHLAERAAAMKIAHDNLLEACPAVYGRMQGLLGLDFDVNFVIYVGIGLGAGWATTYEEKPAVLFGLENIAECGWTESPAIDGLVAHELGHLLHFERRKAARVVKGEGPWWQLYTEGFAQRIEWALLGRWHIQDGNSGRNWLAWCRENQGFLAREFLRTADSGGDIRPFFGSWFDIQGTSQTGYYLGYKLIQLLEKELDLDQITLLEAADPKLRRCLEKIAED